MARANGNGYSLHVLLALLLSALPWTPASGRMAFAQQEAEARDELRRILEREEFQDRFQREGVAPSLPDLPEVSIPEEVAQRIRNMARWTGDKFGDFWKWLWGDGSRRSSGKSWLNQGAGAVASLSSVIVWVLIGVIAVILGVLIYRMLSETRRRPSGAAGGAPAAGMEQAAVTENALDFAAPEWLAFAEKWAKAGDYRAAVRALYLGLLVSLHRARAITYDKNKTNWEYVLEMRRPEDARPMFSAMTTVFDWKWYGMEPVNEDEYRRVQADALRIAKMLDAAPHA